MLWTSRQSGDTTHPPSSHRLFKGAQSSASSLLVKDDEMGQNDAKAEGCSVSNNQSHNLTREEASIFANKNLLVPVDWHLPSSWHINQGGLAIPPLSRGEELEALIAQRRLLLHEAANLNWAANRELWTAKL
jgi:hypothetical protein